MSRFMNAVGDYALVAVSIVAWCAIAVVALFAAYALVAWAVN